MKTVLITGTSRGLGLAIARELARDHRVIGLARGPIAESSQEPEPFEHRAGIDLADSRALDQLAETLAQCDVLINNSAVAHDGILATQSREAIEQMLQLNLFSVIYLTKMYVRERLAERRSGVVLNVSSIVAQHGYRGLAVYGATKGAVVSMTRAMAREMGSKGFRFNALLPGFIETQMSSALEPSQRERIIRRTPLGRLATVADITPVVRFLVSDDAAFISGQEIVVDGGLTA